MYFIIANIVFSSVFTLCIKWVQVKTQRDMITIGMINYIVAAGITYWRSPVTSELDLYALGCGLNMGLTYFVAFFFVVYAVRVIGAAASTVVGSLALVVPIIAAAFVWDDVPNLLEIFGIFVALCSLMLIGTSRVQDSGPTGGATSLQDGPAKNGSESRREFWKTTFVLVFFFLLCGNSRLSQEALKHGAAQESEPAAVEEATVNEQPVSVNEQPESNDDDSKTAERRSQFLLAAFLAAAIPSVVLLFWRRKRISLQEWLVGFVLGSANLLQSEFILRALKELPGFVVFPLTSAGGLVLTTIVATILLGEKLSRKAYVGIALAAIALVLLQVIP